MKATKARKEFKKRFGNANHLLITSLIGLDSIELSGIKKAPSSFNTSWNPKDITSSIHRTRIFTLQSFLGWAVESLEMYMTELNRKPKELESESFTSLFSQANQSIYKKVILIADEIQVDQVLIALMEVLITWRNHSFHYDIDNEIRLQSQNVLIEEKERINHEFCGLDSTLLKKTWEQGGDFTFKETASLISATHKFVEAIDNYAIRNIDIERYIFDSIAPRIKNPKSIQKIKSLPNAKKKRYIETLSKNITGIDKIDDDTCSSIVKRVYSEIIQNEE
ncbi:MAG: hypothetical protein HRT52_03010 [Colwellia sp.]|nr:hypothetical protein [Colwellia sp.]